jgi:hypothetical protein
MDSKQVIRSLLDTADFMAFGFLADLTPEEMLTRPVPDANHIAWQLGHVIWAESRLTEVAMPGSMPKLPAKLEEIHRRGASCSDNPEDFFTKEEYIRLAKEVRAATLHALDAITETDMDRPVTGVPPFVKNAGGCFSTIGAHWIGHVGQWVVVRRRLGRPRMF